MERKLFGAPGTVRTQKTALDISSNKFHFPSIPSSSWALSKTLSLFSSPCNFSSARKLIPPPLQYVRSSTRYVGKVLCPTFGASFRRRRWKDPSPSPSSFLLLLRGERGAIKLFPFSSSPGDFLFTLSRSLANDDDVPISRPGEV